jgi:cobalt-zinc-cadmium efflux system membrane fusion protein
MGDNNMNSFRFTLAAILLTFLATPLTWAQQHDDHDHDEHEPTLVQLSPEELAEFGILLETAGSGFIEVYASLPGEVQANADRLAHIVPRYSGIVTEVRAQTGDQVKQGDVLAIVESDNALTPYELKTLIDGTVIAKHITRGEAVSRDRDTYLIADLSSVWVDLTVYQRDIDRIKVGQEVAIYTGHGPVAGRGTISYITPVIDERTRTATARLTLGNEDGEWRPGMFITAQVLIERLESEVVIPKTAIHTLDERKVVFVETPEGFSPQEVVLGKEGPANIEVLSGLNLGARYVSIGGFTLKAELGKSAFGDGHGH